MGDESVRELERRWRQSGDAQDQGRWLLARVRAGKLPQAALDAAAWLGAPGALHAAPGAAWTQYAVADPWPELLAWSAHLDRLLAHEPEASHRAVLAEAERPLALLEVPPERWPSRLNFIEGPQAGNHVAIAGSAHLDRQGRDVAPAVAALALALDEDGAALLARGQGVLVNGEPVTSARLHHGDLVCPGDVGVLLIFDSEAGDEDTELLRRLRSWLDALTARAVDPAAPAGQELPRLRVRRSYGPEVWLAAQLPALEAAIRERRALPLWPEYLSTPEANRPTCAPEIRASLRAALAPWLMREADPLRARAGSAIDRLEIASPCTMRWEELTRSEVDPRVRHCDQCRLEVFDVAQLTRDEATALLAARTSGRLCMRLYRRPDGRVMTRDCDTVEAQDDDLVGTGNGSLPPEAGVLMVT